MEFQSHRVSNTRMQRRGVRISLPADVNVVILIDASWDQSNKGGTGMMIYNGLGQLVHTEYRQVLAADPLHAEALGLSDALQYLLNNQSAGKGFIFSDCRVLIDAVTQQQLGNLPSWDATETVALCLHKLQSVGGGVELRYANREKLGDPHKVANWARTTAQTFRGCMPASFMNELEIQMTLSTDHYQLPALEGIG